MDKCSNQPLKKFNNKYNNEISEVITKELRLITNYLKGTSLDEIVFKNISRGEKNKFFLDYNRKILFYAPTNLISKWMLTSYADYHFENITKKNFSLYMVKPKMQVQGFFDAFNSMFSTIANATTFATQIARNYNNPQIMAWVLDVLTITLEMNDPFFWRPISLLKFLTRVYSVIMRFSDYKNNVLRPFQTQSLDDITSVDSLILMLACFGLPDTLMKSVKQISLFTNKKLLDSPNVLMDLIQRFLEVFYDMLMWLKETVKLDIVDKVISLLSQPLNFVKGVKLTKQLSEQTLSFQKNNQIIFDPLYRVKVADLHKDILTNAYIQALILNPAYKIYAQQYSLLNTINKLVKNFDTSARSEPVCVVFEGKAGSGKSTIMNKVIEYMAKKSFSIYNHTCPTVDAGKDFYDDYMDQDIFVMDDVGQQGVSQWRQIINFVSSVKFPLDCASADLKNTKSFNSKLLLITTNRFSNLHGFTKTDCISEPQALFRRCHVMNFDSVKFVNGEMVGTIQYKKFDYITETWHTKFIGVQENSPINPKLEVTSDNNTVAWIYAIIKYCLDRQSDIYENNALTNADEVEIDALVDEISSSYYTTQTGILSTFITEENIELFKEYFSYVHNGIVQNTVKIFNTVVTNIQESTIPGFMMTTIFEGMLSTLVVSAVTRIYNYFLGGVEVDQLQIDRIRQSHVEQWRHAHTRYLGQTLPISTGGSSNDTIEEMVTTPKPKMLSSRVQSLQNKMRVIELISSNGYRNVAQGIISGRRAIVQCHSYDREKGVANVFRDWFCYGNNSYECNNVPFKLIREWPEYDMSIIELDLTIPIYKDATHSLFVADDDENKASIAKKLYFINSENVISIDNNFTINKDAFQVQNPVNKKLYTAMQGSGITYPITAPGLCGTLIVDAELGLCGIHVAGTTEQGFAFVLPKRILRTLNQLLTFKDSKHLGLKDCCEADYSGMKLFNDVFTSKRPLTQTRLTKSEMHEDLQEEIQQVGEKLPPNFTAFGSKTLEKIAEKSMKPIPVLDTDEIEFGKRCIERFLIEFDDLTDTEVIKGIKEEELSSLNKNSVNGYGYEKDKSLYLDFDKGIVTPEFENILHTFIEKCNTDSLEIKDLLFYEAFKDELRVKEKIDKPRSFRVAPLHHTFLVKKTLGKLFAHCKKNMWSNQMFIGINPYKDWDRLYKLLKTAFINFDGDFGNWDGGAPAQIQDAIAEIVFNKYTGNNKEVLRKLLGSMIRTFVLIKEKVVLTTHSMPSGSWITAFFNSLMNRFLTAMVLYREKKRYGETATVKDFDRIIDAVFGDDKVCGVPESLSIYVNAITMRDFAESIGMRYTDAEKGEITEPSKPLADCNFLKRSFRYHKKLGKIVGPLSLATIANSLCWKDSSKDYDQVMAGKMTAFQYEIFLHENEKIKNKVLEVARSKSFYFPEFDDAHISKTMGDADTYQQIMEHLGKNYANFC